MATKAKELDWQAIKQKSMERLVLIGCIALIATMSSWYTPSAKGIDVKKNTEKVKTLENKVESIGKGLEETKDKVKDLRNGIRIVLSGMCIMNEKTCRLKEDFGK